MNTPDDFDTTKVEGYHVDNSMQFGFNLNDKLVKVDFSTEIKTESKAQNSKESTGNFHFVFIYHVDNLLLFHGIDKTFRIVENDSL